MLDSDRIVWLSFVTSKPWKGGKLTEWYAEVARSKSRSISVGSRGCSGINDDATDAKPESLTGGKKYPSSGKESLIDSKDCIFLEGKWMLRHSV